MPEDIGFLGYLYAKVPEEKIKERMDHFKELAQQLIIIRKSGHLRVKKIREAKGGKRTRR